MSKASDLEFKEGQLKLAEGVLACPGYAEILLRRFRVLRSEHSAKLKDPGLSAAQRAEHLHAVLVLEELAGNEQEGRPPVLEKLRDDLKKTIANLKK